MAADSREISCLEKMEKRSVGDLEVDMDEVGEFEGLDERLEDTRFWPGLKRIDESCRSWSRRLEQRYDDDDEDEEEQSRSRMGIVQVGLLVIVLGSIFLAFLDSFSSTRHSNSYYEEEDGNRDQDLGPEWEAGGVGKEEVHVHIVRDLEYRQDSPAASATFLPLDSTAFSSSLTAVATGAVATPQRVFQVDAPVLGAGGFIFDGDNTTASTLGASESGTTCSVTLMEFSFAESFGKPFVGMFPR